MPITLEPPFIPTHVKHRLRYQHIRLLVSVAQILKQMTKLGMDPLPLQTTSTLYFLISYHQ